ncbi:MAG TPA: zf-HC2 domain-containing protein, partial [Ktedonobacteraceae bacterium]|nr:zf-HC2 domain-containing protein [Ktedonobacteraceae bacterium]
MSEQEQPGRQTSCLEESQVMAWLDGALSQAAADGVKAHLATCARCAALEWSMAMERRQIVALLSSIDLPPSAAAEPVVALAHFRERLALLAEGTDRSANAPQVDDPFLPENPSLTGPAELERGTLLPIALPGVPPRRPRVWLQTLVAAVIIVVLLGPVLLVRTGLLSIGNHPSTSQTAASLKLSTSQVQFTKDSSAPQQVQLTISNFKSNDRVLLTRDSQEAIQTVPGAAIVSQNPAIVNVDANGSATATIIVTTNWGYGSHTIYAEDIHSQFTASASLLVIGATPSQPAHLMITSGVGSSTPLTTFALGPDIQGSITPKTIYLKNSSQSGSITWSASSNQSWLLISPDAGTFNQSQTIVVAVQRGNLHPGSYNNGVIKFYSNVDAVQSVTVTMAVTSPPPGTSVMALSPAVLSFVTTDGVNTNLSPARPCQTLTISNPGSQPLYWSLTTTSSSGEGTSGSWLTTSPSSGSIPVSSYQLVSVCAQSAGLLPGAYLGALQMSAPGAADSLQTVSISLTVQPHCGLVTTSGFLTFTSVQGKASAGSQGLGL